jgi:hypothetical protein
MVEMPAGLAVRVAMPGEFTAHLLKVHERPRNTSKG